MLWTFALQSVHVPGDFFECGVYQGGTARLLAEALGSRDLTRRLHLFDTFAGMPSTGGHDLYKPGDFDDTTLSSVRQFVGHSEIAAFHSGLIPQTFDGLSDLAIAFAHIDVDIYRSVLDCCEFIYPRLSAGGVLVFDDYGFATCPGARKAVDEFFCGKRERPLVLPNGQAVVTRHHRLRLLRAVSHRYGPHHRHIASQALPPPHRILSISAEDDPTTAASVGGAILTPRHYISPSARDSLFLFALRHGRTWAAVLLVVALFFDAAEAMIDVEVRSA